MATSPLGGILDLGGLADSPLGSILGLLTSGGTGSLGSSTPDVPEPPVVVTT